MMTSDQILLIKKSWKVFRSIDPLVIGDVFYGKLFHDHPDLRRMFPKDMNDLYRKFMDMMSSLIGRLDHLQEKYEDIKAMSNRHAHYGVRKEHYEAVGVALLWTLERGLGHDWTDEVLHAWQALYVEISTMMIEASTSLPSN
jgi:hemoglobin-like flavoprotein